MDANHLFSGNCLVCRAASKAFFCEQCETDMLFPVNTRCLVCAIQTASVMQVCGDCLSNAPEIDITEVLYSYRYPVDSLIKTGKFDGKPELLAEFADRLANKLIRRQGELPEALIPVPLHPARQRQRGFNQSAIIAKRLALRLDLKTINKAVIRRGNSTPQSSLRGDARKRNISGVFDLIEAPAVQHVAIIDDVITTGATVNELAALLRKAGCYEIEAWAIARTEH